MNRYEKKCDRDEKNRPEMRPVEKISEQMITFPEGDT